MNLKRAEIKGRVTKVVEVAGAGVNADRLASLLASELDGEFDAAAYDAKMAALFGDDYYGQVRSHCAHVVCSCVLDAASPNSVHVDA